MIYDKLVNNKPIRIIDLLEEFYLLIQLKQNKITLNSINNLKKVNRIY